MEGMQSGTAAGGGRSPPWPPPSWEEARWGTRTARDGAATRVPPRITLTTTALTPSWPPKSSSPTTPTAARIPPHPAPRGVQLVEPRRSHRAHDLPAVPLSIHTSTTERGTEGRAEGELRIEEEQRRAQEDRGALQGRGVESGGDEQAQGKGHDDGAHDGTTRCREPDCPRIPGVSSVLHNRRRCCQSAPVDGGGHVPGIDGVHSPARSCRHAGCRRHDSSGHAPIQPIRSASGTGWCTAK